jgi:hypothetical protein
MYRGYNEESLRRNLRGALKQMEALLLCAYFPREGEDATHQTAVQVFFNQLATLLIHDIQVVKKSLLYM